MPKDTFETYDLEDGSVMISKTSVPFGSPKGAVVVIYRQQHDHDDQLTKGWQFFNQDTNTWHDEPHRLIPHDFKHARLGHVGAIRKNTKTMKKVRKLEEYTIR